MKKQLIFILLLSLVMDQTDSLWTEISRDTVIIHKDNTIRPCFGLKSSSQNPIPNLPC